jgi:hypothetical protein
LSAVVLAAGGGLLFARPHRKLERYEARFGNVLVTYGGRDERLLARVQAAVDDLR